MFNYHLLFNLELAASFFEKKVYVIESWNMLSIFINHCSEHQNLIKLLKINKREKK